ncbi:MAG: histidine phosphatase family protein [Deltaproteobacteria bacterium]|nr:MAG: histidine phosphatase family protein [Deltaproteobacteria bacterium]
MELLLIRHALPERIETADGSAADPPLSAIGRAQAERVARWLAADANFAQRAQVSRSELQASEDHKVGERRPSGLIDAVYTSPMRRARETAEPLALALGAAIAVDAGLVEMDHLSDVYVPLEQLKAEDYPRWQELVQRGGLYAGVDLTAFRRNVVASVERAIAAWPGGRVAVVCHGGVINAWAGHVLGIADPFFLDVAYTGVSRFLAASTGERSVRSLNETAHLREVGD